ncbi:uncharacterized protein C4orf19-like [Heterocephalus glaber]|uniref:Uncharacterized protein C4orf19-like n=1 Tax=Heterocephalus glaber TaxID=10181 RepID=A0AAX6S2Z7_HETGA|nr:uncharacterized protein C4orf19-like [Heterocephalus glaber]
MEHKYIEKIQSCFCVLPQDLSPDYVNEVSRSNLDEDCTLQLRSHWRQEVLEPKNALPSEGLSQTESRGRNAAPQESCGPRQGSFPQGDTRRGHCANPRDSTNGMGPRASPQSLRNPQPGSWVSPAQGIHPARPFLEGRDARSQDCVLPSWEETPAMGKGDCRAPAEAESPVLEGQVQDPPLPDWNHPPLWDLAVDSYGDQGRRKKRWWKPLHF